MYPSPQKSSRARTPARTPSRPRNPRSILSSNADSAHQVARLPSPAPTVSSDFDIDNPAWKTFDWSILSTPADKIRTPRIKTIDALRRDCLKKLSDLDTEPFKNNSLKLLIAGIRSIIEQKWKTLIVYFNEECEIPQLSRPWSHKEWRRWDVVHFLVKMAVSYNRACEAAAKAGEGLSSEEADREVLELVGDVLDLGAVAAVGEDGEETIVVKEWERPGTLLTLRCEGVSVGEEVKASVGGEGTSAGGGKVDVDSKP